MGGVLLPELQTYERAVRDAPFLAALREQGVARAGGVRDRARQAPARGVSGAREGVRPARPRRGVRVTARRSCAGCCSARSSARPRRRPTRFARAVVAELARDYRLGLISNNAMPGDHHAAVLRRAGILQHLGCAVWSADFGRRKPAPGDDPATCSRQLRVPRERAIFVGDKLRTDVAAARNARVRSVYIRKRGAPFADARAAARLHDRRLARAARAAAAARLASAEHAAPRSARGSAPRRREVAQRIGKVAALGASRARACETRRPRSRARSRASRSRRTTRRRRRRGPADRAGRRRCRRRRRRPAGRAGAAARASRGASRAASAAWSGVPVFSSARTSASRSQVRSVTSAVTRRVGMPERSTTQRRVRVGAQVVVDAEREHAAAVRDLAQVAAHHGELSDARGEVRILARARAPGS